MRIVHRSSVRPFVRSSVRPSVRPLQIDSSFLLFSFLWIVVHPTRSWDIYIYQSYQALVSGSEGDLGLGGAGCGFIFGKIWQRRKDKHVR